jgi:type III restriction enzyme
MSQRDVNAITGRLSLRAPQSESLKQLASAIEVAPAMLAQDNLFVENIA